MGHRPFLFALLRLVALLLAFGGVSGAPARAALEAEHHRAASIALTPCFKPVLRNETASALLDKPHLFDCAVSQQQLGSGDFWVRIAVPPQASIATRQLRWTSVWQDGAMVSVRYRDGRTAVYPVPSAGSGRFVHIGGYYTLPLRRMVAAETIVFRIENSGNMRGILLSPTLMTSDAVASIDVRRAALYGGFAGLCLALLAYNLMMWRAMRERYMLAYCAMVLASLVYAFMSSAAAAQVFPAMENNLRLRFNYLTLSVTAVCALWFVREFFGSKFISLRTDRWITAVYALVLGAGFGFPLLSIWAARPADQLYFLSFMPLFAIGGVIFWRAWQRGGEIDRLFVFAWTLPLLVNLVRMFHGFGLVPQSFWLDNSTLLAMTVEALISSMIIAHRIRFMQADRDAARANEAQALQLADTDALTGLLNRRALMRAACPTPEQAGHYRLILIDIDHFKAINDSAGHSAGDVVLERVAGVIRASIRPDVLAARIGGEEFALLFPTGNVDRRYYSLLLSRIRALPQVGGRTVTVSMGAANGWLGGSEDDWLELYRCADAALYQAKSGGRNRLVVAPRYRDMAAVA
jgi:diguanylate cyclase (GGDEF)-like protein